MGGGAGRYAGLVGSVAESVSVGDNVINVAVLFDRLAVIVLMYLHPDDCTMRRWLVLVSVAVLHVLNLHGRA